MPHYLENLRKLKGKVKKEEEPDGIVTRGPGIVWSVFLVISPLFVSQTRPEL
jgi:hypothetical protein